MVTNKKIKVVDDVIKVPAKKYITTDGMEFIDGNAEKDLEELKDAMVRLVK